MVSLENNVITRPATCLTGAVAGAGGGGGAGAAGAGGPAAFTAAGALALSGTDATPGLMLAAVLFAVGAAAFVLRRSLKPRAAHRMN
jgi:hypothetical protein